MSRGRARRGNGLDAADQLADADVATLNAAITEGWTNLCRSTARGVALGAIAP